ncbi:gamma-glutamyltransferase [Parvibium lacunae]|uniref:Glutathione hydrolase proenzyme n=1 Tax=Parvibium lacunae TaxID=1888893 RepID=A0A368L0W9_9BURK|nr:gamma-glutamyltransferase [Parvibium lacunae]RCS57047.1 gamma-glutamyltransferase [Parvibium lacunae]
MPKNCQTIFTIAALCSLLLGCASPEPFRYQALPPKVALPPAPEGSSGWQDKPGWRAKNFMVAAANPLAADAGRQILRAGGSAVDAAIAIQMVLTLVEPQSSGIGGGAFMLHDDGKTVLAYDGRETAPQAADAALFLHPDGKPLPFVTAAVGGRSVGVPGVLRMLALAHQQHGKLPWATLFEPAIALAEQGFPISPRLHTLLQQDLALGSQSLLAQDGFAREYFYTSAGAPKAVGTILKNPLLATTLRHLARQGADYFYTGALASAIVQKVRQHPTNPGVLAEADLRQYQAKIRPALCHDYRQYRICGMPPPSSGAVALAQILGVLEHTDIARYRPEQGNAGEWLLHPQAVHLYSEAARLAYADRGQHVADPDFVRVPVAGLLDKNYLARRAQLLGERSMVKANPGVPPGVSMSWAPDRSPELPSTSHLSVVDQFGQAVSMTTTIEAAWGSKLMLGGFLLNNQLTDFSFVSQENGVPVANRLEPGKRPRSSMAPTLVYDREQKTLLFALGSPGGSAIINYVGKTLVGVLDWGLDVQQAINLPNFGSRNGPTELEKGRAPEALIEALRARGHSVNIIDQTSGLQGIQREAGGWFAGADPRREGVAMGE